jgi:hypothetical protein
MGYQSTPCGRSRLFIRQDNSCPYGGAFYTDGVDDRRKSEKPSEANADPKIASQNIPSPAPITPMKPGIKPSKKRPSPHSRASGLGTTGISF